MDPITECDGCPNEAVVLDGENDGTLIGGECTQCGYYVTRYITEFCSVCGQADNCGDCDHTPLDLNPSV